MKHSSLIYGKLWWGNRYAHSRCLSSQIWKPAKPNARCLVDNNNKWCRPSVSWPFYEKSSPSAFDEDGYPTMLPGQHSSSADLTQSLVHDLQLLSSREEFEKLHSSWLWGGLSSGFTEQLEYPTISNAPDPALLFGAMLFLCLEYHSACLDSSCSTTNTNLSASPGKPSLIVCHMNCVGTFPLYSHSSPYLNTFSY